MGVRKEDSPDPYGPSSPQALGNILAYLSDAKRKLRQVVWINLREEVVLVCDGHMHSLWPPGPTLPPEQLEVSKVSGLLHGLHRRHSGVKRDKGEKPEGLVFLLFGCWS